MAQMTIPNTFKGGKIIDASKHMENYTTVVEALSDGTKDISVGTTQISSDLNTTKLTITGDVTVTEPGGRVLLPLIRSYAEGGIYTPGFGSVLPQAYRGTFVAGNTSPGIVMPRSGMVVGIGVQFIYSGTATQNEFYWNIRGAGASTISPTIYASQTGDSTTTYVKFNPATQTSFAAGAVIYAQKTVVESNLSTHNCTENLTVEIQYT